MNRLVDIYYFSGTGNTLLAVKTLKEKLEPAGFCVRLLRLEKSDPLLVDTSHVLGLAFPVAMSTYPFVWRFIDALPPGQGAEAFMLATMGGGSVGLAGALKRKLLDKGYRPVAACEAKMPVNIFYIMNDSSKILADGLDSVGEFARAISESRGRWREIPLFSWLAHQLYRAVISSWGWQWHQKLFRMKLSESKCVRCGLCAKLCPVDNISMEGRPVFGLRCEYCLRCVSYCPSGAIKTPFIFNNKIYRAAPLPYLE